MAFTITIDNVTADNVINGSESSSGFNISGSVTDEATGLPPLVSNPITVEIKDADGIVLWSGSTNVQSDGTWTISVPANLDFLPSSIYTVTATITGALPATSGSSQHNFSTDDTACFCRGTLIMTPEGERPIEQLAIGDRVLTVSGEAKPIRWIGHRAYDGRFTIGKNSIRPIRIKAGALADGVPKRDLFVSPEHALVIEGLFLPARLLTNGATIRQVEHVDRLEYFHIELDAHDVIFAEGAPAETFVDFGGRGIFENSAEFASLYPAAAPAEWEPYRALLDQGMAGLPAIRAKLLMRAAALGRVTRDPDLRLIVDGNRVPAQSAENQVYSFPVPHGACSVRLVSRSVVPAETHPSSLDPRRLGVPVKRVVLRGGDLRIEIGADCAALSDGFHQPERSHRWTDGGGAIPPRLLACFAGDFALEVQIGRIGLHYPSDAPAEYAELAPSSDQPSATPRRGSKHLSGLSVGGTVQRQ